MFHLDGEPYASPSSPAWGEGGIWWTEPTARPSHMSKEPPELNSLRTTGQRWNNDLRECHMPWHDTLTASAIDTLEGGDIPHFLVK